MFSTLRISVSAGLLCVLLGCGGGGAAQPDRGLEQGSGQVDANAADPIAGMDADENWPMWRGPDGSGVADGQDLPDEFGEDVNVVWKTKIPGRGHSSPTIVGDRIFLATADESAETQSVLALDRATGAVVWAKELHSGGFPPTREMHSKSSHASCAIACDGDRLFVAFLNHDKIHLTALDLEGEIVWQKEAGDFDSKFGYAPSPTLYKSSVIVTADHKSGGHITSWDRETGELNWRIERPAVSTYASPIVHTIDGKDQLLIAGARRIASYDPVSGEENWSAEGVAEACVGTVVVDGNTVLASGGYPQAETLAVDGTNGDILWRNRDKSYAPSLVARDGRVYMVNQDGVAAGYDSRTGDELWRKRLDQKGDISASPLLADGRLFTISEGGDLFVLAASSDESEQLRKVRIGDVAFASPVASGDRLYLRVATNDDGYQEWLYCFGE